MPSLLDLANETLYHIIGDIHPHDILNFALCRKQIYLLTQKTLQEHKSWKQTYTHVVLDGCHRHQNYSHPLQLIREVCMNWKIGEFPKSLRVECCDFDESESESDYEDIKQYEAEKREDDVTIQTIMQDIGNYVREKATTSADLPDITWKNLWSSIDIGNRAPMIGLLFLFFPNLEIICLNSYTWNASAMGGIVDMIASRDLHGNLARTEALTRVSEIQIFGGPNNVAGEDVEYLLPFAALPSLRTISGNFLSSFFDEPMGWPPGFRSSNVTEITLQRSGIETKDLTQLLSGVNNLKRFTYSHNAVLADDRASMEAHKIIGILLEHARHSLEYLSLTGDCHSHNADHDQHSNNGSLQGFSVLKEVLLHSAIYVDQVPYDGLSPDPDEGLYGPRNKDVIQALVDVLPPSIETVQLTGPYLLRRRLDHLLANLSKQKNLRIPKLNRITVLSQPWHKPIPGFESLTQTCNDVGVTLELVPEED